jgi:hypothetical protein
MALCVTVSKVKVLLNLTVRTNCKVILTQSSLNCNHTVTVRLLHIAFVRLHDVDRG